MDYQREVGFKRVIDKMLGIAESSFLSAAKNDADIFNGFGYIFLRWG